MTLVTGHGLMLPRSLPMLTLRAKGLLLLIPLLLYVIGVSALMIDERRRMLDELAELALAASVPATDRRTAAGAWRPPAEMQAASRAQIEQGLRFQYESVHGVALTLAAMGFALFAGLIYLFFTRLAADLGLVRRRAGEIVAGYRGPALALSRSDELGELAAAVDAIGAGLAQREKEVEFGRRQYYYHDKMASVGTLAAGIAHEIGNPVAAIAGEAQTIAETAALRSCAVRGAPCRPQVILAQVDRIAAITRKVGEFAAPRSPDPELLDLNSLVETTCSFVRYDRRLRSVLLVEELDRRVPAVHGVPDQIAQVLLNLLINAADALDDVERRERRIEVTTGCEAEGVFLAVADNGCGMDEATRARAFEAFFTTKPADRGTGLGLSLVRSFAEGAGGRVEIESRPQVGTRVTLHLPTLPSGGAS